MMLHTIQHVHVFQSVAIVLAFCVGSAVGVGAQRDETEDALLRRIQAQWRERQARATTVSCSWSGSYLVIAGTERYTDRTGKRVPFPPKDTVLNRRYRAVFSGLNKVRYEYHGPIRTPDTGRYEDSWYLNVTDGSVQRCFFAGNDRGASPYPSRGFIPASAQDTVEFDTCDLAAILLIYRPLHPRLAERVDLTKALVISTGGELRGARCVVIRNISEQTRVDMWVDETNGYVPMRYQEFVADARNASGWRLAFQIDITYKTDDGMSAPASWEYSGFGSRSNLVFQGKATVHECQVNEAVPDSLFRFEFPPRTQVWDEKAERAYLILDNGRQRPVTEYEMAARIPFHQLLATPPQYHAPGPSAWWTWGIATVIVTVGVFAVLWKRRG